MHVSLIDVVEKDRTLNNTSKIHFFTRSFLQDWTSGTSYDFCHPMYRLEAKKRNLCN